MGLHNIVGCSQGSGLLKVLHTAVVTHDENISVVVNAQLLHQIEDVTDSCIHIFCHGSIAWVVVFCAPGLGPEVFVRFFIGYQV
ncbi:hypothetical protein ES703_120948 [subsurface metagenome]